MSDRRVLNGFHVATAVVAGVVVAAMVAAGLSWAGFLPGSRGGGSGGDGPVVRSQGEVPKPEKLSAPELQREPASVRWPAPSSDLVSVPVGGNRRAGDSVLTVGPLTGAVGAVAGSVSTTVLKRDDAVALGGPQTATAVKVTVPPDVASVQVKVDTSGFADAFGGSYQSRLRLVALPGGCALSQPTCEPTVLPTSIDLRGKSMTAVVPTASRQSRGSQQGGLVDRAAERLPAGGGAATSAVDSMGAFTILATSAPSGEGGDYTASPLSVADSWSVGTNTGDFQYSYPFEAPATVGGATPDLSLGYSSGRVDGMTSASNEQSSMVGDGWGDVGDNFIERQYRSCKVDNGSGATATGDLCWGPNVRYVLHLNGRTSEMIRGTGDAANEFRLKVDPGWRIRIGTGITPNNGDNDGEFFTVETPDGMDYTFGRGESLGSSPVPTVSVWTVPVYGDDAGEPCHASTFAASMCYQGWRWNLDRVVDRFGNYQSWIYGQDTNRYKRNTAGDAIYVRGGWLKQVQYGGRASGSAAVMGPTARFIFTPVGRCVEATTDPTATCPPATAANATSYPDTPIDLICGTGCTHQAPTFFSTRRLWQVETQRLGATWLPVRLYRLTGGFVSAHDGEKSRLWLQEIRGSGKAGSTVDLPPVQFGGIVKPNRVEEGPGLSTLSRYRIGTVITELGGRINVTYGHAGGAALCTDAMVSDPANPYPANTNEKECFPKYWSPPSGSPGFSWFHKYVVVAVTNTDPTTGTGFDPSGRTLLSEPRRITYAYGGGAAWHHDDDRNADPATQSWSDWRGYQTVVVHNKTVADGVVLGDRSMTKYVYYRGMHGDKLTATTTKTETVATIEDATDPDDINPLAGRPAEISTLTGGSTRLKRIYYNYIGFKTVDTGEVTGFTSRDAWKIEARDVRTRTFADDVQDKIKQKTTSEYYTANGDPLSMLNGARANVSDTGVEATSGDETCTAVRYRYNTTLWLMAPTLERSWTNGECTDNTQMFSRKDTLYYSTQPDVNQTDDPNMVRGVPAVQRAYSNASTFAETIIGYDGYGRALAMTDGRGATTTTAFSPAEGVPSTITVTAPKPDGTVGDANTRTTTAIDIATNLPTSVTDWNGKVTGYDYDALGRVTSIDPPATAHYTFAYDVNNDAPSRVRTETPEMNGDTAASEVSWTFLDGFGRTIQTQMRPRSGSQIDMVLGITRYDDRGLVQGTTPPVTATGTPGDAWIDVDRNTIPNEQRTTYDPLGEVYSSEQWSNGSKLWQTVTTRDGNNTLVTRPVGGTLDYGIDVDGNTASITERTLGGTTVAVTELDYYPSNLLKQVTSPNGRAFTYVYDWLGRKTSQSDPDTGATSSTYDANGNVLSITDARGITIQTVYDAQNRPTRRFKGAAAPGTTLATWTYDTATNGKGRPATSTAKITPPGGTTPLDYKRTITGYDAGGNPSGTTTEIPAGFGVPAAQTYTETATHDNGGHLRTLALPAIGGLPAETLTARYTTAGNPNSLTTTGSGGTLVASTSFNNAGQITGRRWEGASGPLRSYTYNDIAQLTGATTTSGGNTLQADTYTYNGPQLTRVTDTLTGQRQCYDYDDLNRLTHAWTTNVNCTDAASPNRTFGPAPYDQSWTYDDDNSLITATEAAGPNPRTQTYAYPATVTAGVPIHGASSVTTTGTGAGSTALTYDASGYLVSRAPSGSPAQTLTWDDQHQLVASSNTDGTSGVTRYAYDANGTRLIRQTPTETTLTLGATDVVFPAAGGTATGRRHYTLGGATVALRDTTSGTSTLSFLAADGQGSTDIAITAGTHTFTRTRYTPYGQARTPTGGALGTLGTGLPTDHGWLGKTLDKTTGLNHLDARYYDATTTTFTAPDPLFNPTNPRTVNPYTYALANPIAYWDPTGLEPGSWCTTSDCAVVNSQHQTSHPMEAGQDSKGNTRKRKAYKVDPEIYASAYVRHHGETTKPVPFAPGKGTPDTDAGTQLYQQAMQQWSSIHNDDPYPGSEEAHEVFAVAGILNPLFDVIDALGYAAEGDKTGAALAIVGIIPFADPVSVSWRLLRGTCKASSFDPDTAVLMADGATKPIKDIKVGDKVLATDPKTGTTRPEPVTDVITSSGDKDMVQVTVKTPTGTGTVLATDEHPFWSTTTKTWTNAEDLRPGVTLRDHRGATGIVTSSRHLPRNQTVRNLTVANLHTYYVIAGNTPVLVHNCGWQAPDITVNRHGQLTNGRYTLDAPGMEKHVNGTPGASQFGFYINSGRATLDAAAYADEFGLWVGAKAKVPVSNGIVGYTGKGVPTTWINVYRAKSGFVHGAPGNAP